MERKSYEVQADKIIVSFHSVEPDSETPRVASLIWELSSKSDSRESDKGGSLLSLGRKKVGFLRYDQLMLICSGLWPDVL